MRSTTIHRFFRAVAVGAVIALVAGPAWSQPEVDELMPPTTSGTTAASPGAAAVAPVVDPVAPPPPPRRIREAPHLLLLIGGAAVIAGGFAGELVIATVADDGDTCLRDDAFAGSRADGCLIGLQVSALAQLGGAAMTTAYGWKLGEHAYHRDAAAGLVDDLTPYRGLGWTTVIAGALGRLGGAIYVVYRAAQCAADGDCGSSLRAAAIVDVVTAGVLASGTGMVAYSYAYEGEAKDDDARLAILPAAMPGGAGLAFTFDW